MTQLTMNLAGAWVLRHQEAIAELQHAGAALALFKAEHVQQLQGNAVQAIGEYQRWELSA